MFRIKIMETFKERLLHVLDYKNISQYALEKRLNLSKGYMNKLNDPVLSKVVKILHYFPDLNPMWLLLGEGTMIKTATQTQAPAITNNSHNHVEGDNNKVGNIAATTDTAALEMKIQMLERENARLWAILERQVSGIGQN